VWPWLTAGALLVALAGLAARVLSTRLRRFIAAVVLPVSILGCLSAWFGILVAGGVTIPMIVFATGFAGATALFLLVVVTATSGEEQLGVMALIGALATTFALPQIAIFEHGFVLSALPAMAARGAVATALVGGIAVATVSIPSVLKALAV
jgi:hypothetical protein